MKIDTSIRTFLTGIGTSITSGLKGIKEGIHKIKHGEFSCKNILDNNGAIKGSMILFCSILRFVTKKLTPKKIKKLDRGIHSGMTPDEMFVPVIVARGE